MKELKRVFRSCCKMPNFLYFTDTIKLLCFFLLSKSNYALLIKNSILLHPLTESHLKNLEIIAPKDSELTLLVAEKPTMLKDLRY